MSCRIMVGGGLCRGTRAEDKNKTRSPIGENSGKGVREFGEQCRYGGGMRKSLRDQGKDAKRARLGLRRRSMKGGEK